MNISEFSGFLVFLGVFTMGFWLLLFVATFVIPYWIAGYLLEAWKFRKGGAPEPKK